MCVASRVFAGVKNGDNSHAANSNQCAVRKRPKKCPCKSARLLYHYFFSFTSWLLDLQMASSVKIQGPQTLEL